LRPRIELLGCQSWMIHSDGGIAKTPGRDAIRDRSLARGFYGEWRSSSSRTLRAEHCEALIGAIYRVSGKVTPIQTWLTPYWCETSRDELVDPHRGNSKSALQEWTQSQGLGLPTYVCQQISQRHGDPRRFHCRVFI